MAVASTSRGVLLIVAMVLVLAFLAVAALLLVAIMTLPVLQESGAGTARG